MVNATMDIQRLESGDVPLRREPVKVAELVEQIYHLQSPLASEMDILLLNNVPFDLPVVSVDHMLIGRVFQNLIDNTVKFTPNGGSVEVFARRDSVGQSILVTIHDSGPGISLDRRERLFQKFATCPSPRRGAGLGLVFCRLAIEAHGGRIWAESEEGQGTTFFFTLPLDVS